METIVLVLVAVLLSLGVATVIVSLACDDDQPGPEDELI